MFAKNKSSRLNLVRYGMLLVVVMAMTITPVALYMDGDKIFSDIIAQTIIATCLACTVALGAYYSYRGYIEK